MRKWFLIVACLCAVMCTRHTVRLPVDAQSEIVCTWNTGETPIKKPESIAMLDSAHFVLADGNSVYLYDIHDGSVLKIGNSGRARFEYNRPNIVRCHNDTIFVWSSLSLKFIAYSRDGKPFEEYTYHSALRDFLPGNHKIFISTSGKAGKNVIDVYDLNSHEVTCHLTESSKSHVFLQRQVSVAPMWYEEGTFYYFSRDNLVLHKYDLAANKDDIDTPISSETFTVETGLDPGWIKTDRERLFRALEENSKTLYLFKAGRKLYLLTIEGKDSGQEDNADGSMGRYLTLYDVSAKKATCRYKYESVGTMSLFSCLNGNLYFMKHSVEGQEDIYTLNKLIIK